MKVVLIILALAGSTDGGIAIKEIEGFSSLATCEAAAKTLPANILDNGFLGAGIIRTNCVEVK